MTDWSYERIEREFRWNLRCLWCRIVGHDWDKPNQDDWPPLVCRRCRKLLRAGRAE